MNVKKCIIVREMLNNMKCFRFRIRFSKIVGDKKKVEAKNAIASWQECLTR